MSASATRSPQIHELAPGYTSTESVLRGANELLQSIGHVPEFQEFCQKAGYPLDTDGGQDYGSADWRAVADFAYSDGEFLRERFGHEGIIPAELILLTPYALRAQAQIDAYRGGDALVSRQDYNNARDYVLFYQSEVKRFERDFPQTEVNTLCAALVRAGMTSGEPRGDMWRFAVGRVNGAYAELIFEALTASDAGFTVTPTSAAVDKSGVDYDVQMLCDDGNIRIVPIDVKVDVTVAQGAEGGLWTGDSSSGERSGAAYRIVHYRDGRAILAISPLPIDRLRSRHNFVISTDDIDDYAHAVHEAMQEAVLQEPDAWELIA